MFKSCFYFLFLFVFIGCNSNKNTIQFNGVYQSSKIDKNYYYYIRFYKNDSVIDVSSSGKPRHLKRWFKKEKEDIPKGTYYCKNDSLFFKTKSSSGIVEYKGKLIRGKLFLNHNSKINGHKSLNTYTFKRINFE